MGQQLSIFPSYCSGPYLCETNALSLFVVGLEVDLVMRAPSGASSYEDTFLR